MKTIKEGCLVSIVLVIISVTIIIANSMFFSAKTATEQKMKDVLNMEFAKITDSVLLRGEVAMLKFLQNNKAEILDSLQLTSNYANILINLKYDNQGAPHLPKRIFDSISNINPKERFEPEITENNKFGLVYSVTDYDNYVYLNHGIYKKDTLEYLNGFGNNIKTIHLNNGFEYRLHIENAFHDIDPNNLAPN